MPQGYDGLPPSYIGKGNPLTPNLGLSLSGADPLIAENFWLIDVFAGSSSGSTVNVNGSPVTNPNFNGTTPAAPGGNTNVTFQVSGSNVSAYVSSSSGATINPTNNVIPVRSNATTFVDSPLYVASATNILMGTQTPASGYDIEVHDTYFGLASFFTHSNTGFQGPELFLGRSRGTVASPTSVQAGDTLGYFTFKGWNGTAYVNGSQLASQANVNFDATHNSATLDVLDGTNVLVFRFNDTLGATLSNISSYNLGVSRQIINSVIGWVASVGSPFDTAFSRLANGIVGLGNGTPGDISGILEANQYKIGTFPSVGSISQFGPAGNGSTDDSAIFTTAAATYSTITLAPNTSYFIGSNLTLTADIQFQGGSKLIVGNGASLVLNGQVQASADQQIFVTSGTTQTVSDNFQRANENPLSDGGNWTAWGYSVGTTNTGQIVSQLVEPTATSVLGMALFTGIGTPSANQYSEATIQNATSKGNTNIYVIVRGSTSAGTGYVAFVSGFGANANFYLYKYVANTGTQVFVTTQTVAANDKLRLAVTTVGSNAVLSLFYNGRLITSYTDSSSPIASGFPGFGVYSTAAIADAQVSNWTGGTFNAGTLTLGVNNPYVYPEWFGAVGDGSTNDSGPIQLAINSISTSGLGYVSPPTNAGGGYVVLKNKTYAVGSVLTIASSWVGIKGGGDRNSILYFIGDTASDVLRVTGTGQSPTTYCSFNYFEDFSIERSASAVSPAAGFNCGFTVITHMARVGSYDSYNCVYFIAQANCYLRDCVAGQLNHAAPNAAYSFNGSNNSSRIVDCIAEGSTYGLYLAGKQAGAGIADIYFEGFETSNCSYGAYLSSQSQVNTTFVNDNVHFVRCIFDTCTVSGYSINNCYNSAAYIELNGCYVEGTCSAPMIDIENSSGVTIRGCDLRTGDTTSGVILINGANSYGNIIEGNQFTNLISSSVVPYYIKVVSSNNNVISNNVILGPDSSHAFTTGIWLVSSLRNIINGNNIQGYGTTGILIDANSTTNVGLNEIDPTNITTQISDLGSNNKILTIGGYPTFASEIKTVDLTAQSAAITATNIAASAPQTGMYRISWSATITGVDGVSSVLGGTNGFQVVYTSPTDSVTKTTVPGNSVTSSANTTGTAIGGCEVVYAKTGTAIQYKMDYTSATPGQMVYELHVKLESM